MPSSTSCETTCARASPRKDPASFALGRSECFALTDRTACGSLRRGCGARRSLRWQTWTEAHRPRAARRGPPRARANTPCCLPPRTCVLVNAWHHAPITSRQASRSAPLNRRRNPTHAPAPSLARERNLRTRRLRGARLDVAPSHCAAGDHPRTQRFEIAGETKLDAGKPVQLPRPAFGSTAMAVPIPPTLSEPRP